MATNLPSSDGRMQVGLVCADPVRAIGLTAILTESGKIEVFPLTGLGAPQDGRCTMALIDSTSTQHLFELLETFQRKYPHLRLIVIGLKSDAEHIQRVIAAGAKGYLSHMAPGAEILTAIDIVADGSMWAPRKIMAKLVENATDRMGVAGKSRDSKITWREGEVLRLLVAGQPNREIARILGIDEVTVKGHVGRLMRKRGVTNRIALSMQAANEYLVASKVDAELNVSRRPLTE